MTFRAVSSPSDFVNYDKAVAHADDDHHSPRGV